MARGGQAVTPGAVGAAQNDAGGHLVAVVGVQSGKGRLGIVIYV